MRVFKSMISMAFVTAMALLYVHQQVELVKMSYAIEFKEKKVKDMLDLRESLGYNINNLEAPSRLEHALSAKRIELTFPRKAQVVKVEKAASGFTREQGIISSIVEKKPGFTGIIEFFGSVREAYAKER